jgi:hypothetical protein
MIRPIHYLQQLGLALSLLLTAQSGAADSIRIMPVGDRDTEGFSVFASYRYDLWFLLMDAGYDVDFVGRATATGGNLQADLYPKYAEFDPQHEGRATTSLSEIASAASGTASVNQPDVVLLMGSIDICHSGSGAPTIARIELPKIIDNMRAVDPGVHFLLGQTYAWESEHCDPNAPQIIPDFNEAWAEVAAAKDTPGSRVLLVDHYSGFDSGSMLSQGRWAANRQGEMFIAQNWFETLEEVLPLVDSDPFAINAGLNDAWYDPATAGQGFLMTVYEDLQIMFLAWFTFETERPPAGTAANLGEPGHRWLTAQGPFEGNRAILDITVSEGGVFDSVDPVPGNRADGTIELVFESCAAGIVNYEIDSLGLQGAIPVQRIANDNVALCDLLSAGGPR